MSALAPNGEPPSVAKSSVTTDVHQSFDVHLHLLAQIALYHALLVYNGANSIDFIFRQFADSLIHIDPGLLKYLIGAAPPNAIDVREADFGSLRGRQIHSG